MSFRTLRTGGAAFPAQQHSATCYLVEGKYVVLREYASDGERPAARSSPE